MSNVLKVRRAMQGLYAITAGTLRFELARSENDPRLWQLCPRSEAAYTALGEPDRAPYFESKRAAVAAVRGIVEEAGKASEPTAPDTWDREADEIRTARDQVLARAQRATEKAARCAPLEARIAELRVGKKSHLATIEIADLEFELRKIR